MDQTDHQTKRHSCSKGRRETERHGVKDDGIGDTHGADRDEDNMTPDEEDPEDEGQDEVKEKEPLDRQLQQDVEQDSQRPKEDASCGTVPKMKRTKTRGPCTKCTREQLGD